MVLVLVFLPATGCHKAGTAPTLKVTATVTYNGKPIEGVNVTFFPEAGRPGTGTTDASGKCIPSTFRPNDGVVPGTHAVAITPVSSGAPTPPPAPAEGEEDEEETVKWPFPKEYADPETSGFTAVVERGGPRDFQFDMTD